METISRLALTFLLNSLWQVTALVALAGACSRAMRRSPSRFHHLLWVTTLALCFLLPVSSLGSPSLTIWPWASHASHAHAGMAPGPAAASPASAWLAEFFRGRSQPVSFAPSVASVLAVCYLLFLLYRVLSLIRAWQKTREISRVASDCGIPGSITAIADECRAAVGLKAASILCSEAIDIPLTLGAKRPVIILPKSLLQAASQDLVSTALGHEMAHIRRRDYFWNLVYELIHLPLSFHPAALFAKRRIRETRELACDEMVAGRLMSARAYARSLVHMASSITAIEHATYSLGIFDADNLEERIMKLTEERPRTSPGRAMILFAAAVFTLSLSAAAASAFSLSIGQGKSAAPPAAQKSIAGLWLLYPRTDEQAGDSKGITVVLESNGDKLSGKAIFSSEFQGPHGHVIKKDVEWPLIDPQFDGMNFSFKVSPPEKDGSGNSHVIEGKMRLAGGDFIGKWSSGGESGELKMIRKKD
jgi:beta-lactamase regulating signal transducer with metallopeptidase domain